MRRALRNPFQAPKMRISRLLVLVVWFVFTALKDALGWVLQRFNEGTITRGLLQGKFRGFGFGVLTVSI